MLIFLIRYYNVIVAISLHFIKIWLLGIAIAYEYDMQVNF